MFALWDLRVVQSDGSGGVVEVLLDVFVLAAHWLCKYVICDFRALLKLAWITACIHMY